MKAQTICDSAHQSSFLFSGIILLGTFNPFLNQFQEVGIADKQIIGTNTHHLFAPGTLLAKYDYYATGILSSVFKDFHCIHLGKVNLLSFIFKGVTIYDQCWNASLLLFRYLCLPHHEKRKQDGDVLFG